MPETKEKLEFTYLLEDAMTEIASKFQPAAFKGSENRDTLFKIICRRAGLDPEDPEMRQIFDKLF